MWCTIVNNHTVISKPLFCGYVSMWCTIVNNHTVISKPLFCGYVSMWLSGDRFSICWQLDGAMVAAFKILTCAQDSNSKYGFFYLIYILFILQIERQLKEFTSLIDAGC